MSTAKTPTLAEVTAWPATVSLTEANRAFGISKSHGYDLAARNAYPAKVLRVGGRIRVLTASLVKVLSAED